MAESFCKWHNKPLKEAAEWQQDQCNVAGRSCSECEDLVPEEEENE